MTKKEHQELRISSPFNDLMRGKRKLFVIIPDIVPQVLVLFCLLILQERECGAPDAVSAANDLAVILKQLIFLIMSYLVGHWPSSNAEVECCNDQ